MPVISVTLLPGYPLRFKSGWFKELQLPLAQSFPLHPPERQSLSTKPAPINATVSLLRRADHRDLLHRNWCFLF